MRVLLIIGVLVACGGDEGSTPDAVGSGDAVGNGDTCDPSCVEQGWWLGTSSSCTVICMANPSLTECMQPDCRAIEASRYQAGMRTSIAPLLYSASARSFYLLGSVTTSAYSVMSDCSLQFGNGIPTSFMCTSAGLQLPTATLEAATSDQRTALDMAATSKMIGRYTY